MRNLQELSENKAHSGENRRKAKPCQALEHRNFNTGRVVFLFWSDTLGSEEFLLGASVPCVRIQHAQACGLNKEKPARFFVRTFRNKELI